MSDSKNFVSIQIPAEDLPKALATLRSYGLPPQIAKLEDKPQALVALRTYGMTEREAQYTLDAEGLLVEDYDRNNQKSLAPELIEIFGSQHVNDALSYTYLFLEDFELLWLEYKNALLTLLKVFRPEELILNPELIRYFLSKLTIKENCITDDLENFGPEEISEMTAEPKNFFELVEECFRADDDEDDEE